MNIEEYRAWREKTKKELQSKEDRIKSKEPIKENKTVKS